MTKRDVVENIIAKLDAKQNDALEKAMNELRREGLIEVKEDGVTLVLTQKGAEFTGN
jgi:predicted transcriptional regulator